MTDRIRHSHDCHMAWMRRLYDGRGKEDECLPGCPQYKSTAIAKRDDYDDDLLIDMDKEIFEWIKQIPGP